MADAFIQSNLQLRQDKTEQEPNIVSLGTPIQHSVCKINKYKYECIFGVDTSSLIL